MKDKSNSFMTSLSRVVPKKDMITYAMLIVMFVAVIILNEGGLLTRQIQSLLILVPVYIILAVSLNLTVGFLGELTLGHAGFMAVGAYTGCLFSIALQSAIPSAWIRFPLAMIIGGLVAALFGLIIGVPVLRLKGDYLAIVTLAFGEIIKTVATNLEVNLSTTVTTASGKEKTLTQGLFGAAGLKNAPQDSTYIVAFIVVFICVIVISNLVNSKQGRAITALRDNRIAAEAVGINVTYFKLLAFVIAAFFAGVAGVIYGCSLTVFKPATFDYNMSIEILVIVVLGGMGSIRGSIIAAIILQVLPEVLRGFSDYRMLVYSIVLVAMMLFNNSPKCIDFRENVKAKLHIGKKKQAEVKEAAHE